MLQCTMNPARNAVIASHVRALGPHRLIRKVLASAQGGSYYPPVPPYQPSEPSAPYLPPGTPIYGSEASASDYSSSSYAPSAVLSEAEQLAALDLEALRASAGTTRNLSFLAFWIQFALSIVSAGVLLFSSAFVPKPPGGFGAGDISQYLTLGGVIASFISSLFAHGFLTLSKKLQNGGTVARNYLVTTLLTNNAICLSGIAVTVIGLQASVGTLVAKSLSTAISSPYPYSPPGGVVSLDVFALQASTNVLLCHVIGLLFTNLMLRIVNRKP